MSITGIFVKYLSSLSFTFFGKVAFFSTSLHAGRHRERPIKDNIRAYWNHNYPSTASESNWLYNEISVCYQVETGMENMPHIQMLWSQWPRAWETSNCLKMAKCHTVFEKLSASLSLEDKTWYCKIYHEEIFLQVLI